MSSSPEPSSRIPTPRRLAAAIASPWTDEPTTGERAQLAELEPRPPRLLVLRTAFWIVVVTAAIAALAWWDLDRDNRAMLGDFATNRLLLATGTSSELKLRLNEARERATLFAREIDAGRPAPRVLTDDYDSMTLEPQPGPSPIEVLTDGRLRLHVRLADGRAVAIGTTFTALLRESHRVEREGEVLVLVHLPGHEGLYAPDGRLLRAPPIEEQSARAPTTVKLTQEQAASIGLPLRMAIAGLATVTDEATGSGDWSLALVASARRQRERQWHAQIRQVLAVLVVGGLVVAVSALSLRSQRQELDLLRRLAVARMSQQRDAKLVRASRAAMMGTLATGVAHEVGTPLGVITARIEQLRSRVGDDERAARSIDAIEKQVEHISRIVRGFLDLARGGDPSLEPLSTAQLVRSAVGLVEHRFSRAGVTLHTELGAALPPTHGDPLLLEHALVNMLLNACEACERGGLVILSVVVDETYLTFQVLDDGVGITTADALRATEPFFTTKPAGQGTGLGLAITHEIAKAHHGSFDIGPASVRGTRAALRIPRVARAGAGGGEPDSPRESPHA
jgi:two-component system NtrC family sensor kinase